MNSDGRKLIITENNRRQIFDIVRSVLNDEATKYLILMYKYDMTREQLALRFDRPLEEVNDILEASLDTIEKVLGYKRGSGL